MIKFFCVLLMIFFFSFSAVAQKRDSVYRPKKEIVINGKRFRVYNNWMNIGSGGGLNSTLPNTQFILNVDLHFHLGWNYFQLGTFLSGDRFLSFNNYNAHLCYGKRWEDENYNFFVCGGPSYSWGYPRVGNHYDPAIFKLYGVYFEAQYIYKLAYDLGVGGSLFADFNARQTVYGLRFVIYFSGAFRGDKNKKEGE